jgi:taurine dioxygenase
MEIHPMTCALGAELKNVNLADAARNDALFGEIKAALLKYKVLFLRNQDIAREQHAAFARRFGELEDHPLTKSSVPGIIQIYKSPEDPPSRYENAWHNDATWREEPPMGAVLRCLECPPVGGDTMWADMVLAYENLPEHIKKDIEGLRARHSIEATFGAGLPRLVSRVRASLAIERLPDDNN